MGDGATEGRLGPVARIDQPAWFANVGWFSSMAPTAGLGHVGVLYYTPDASEVSCTNTGVFSTLSVRGQGLLWHHDHRVGGYGLARGDFPGRPLAVAAWL